MRLAAIYNVWDGVELLKGSINCIKKDVDVIIIVWQEVSNYGEQYDPSDEIRAAIDVVNVEYYFTGYKRVIIHKYTPSFGFQFSAASYEMEKRNIGLKIAKDDNCTHFLHLDCDEYYEDFGKAKQEYIESGSKGSVCSMWTYFKKPTLRFENTDNYFVPFIHELNNKTIAGQSQYPFYVDPTRRINEQNVVLLDAKMHHFSWIRTNIARKVRNSSAKHNILRSNYLNDYNSPDLGVGYYVTDFRQKLVEVPNIFNINI